MTVSLLVVIFFAFISYFAGRLTSHKISTLPKRDRIIIIIFWAFLIGSIMLFLKWLQLNNAVAHNYEEMQGIKNAKANFMDIYFIGCYVFSIFIGIAFHLGLSPRKTQTI